MADGVFEGSNVGPEVVVAAENVAAESHNGIGTGEQGSDSSPGCVTSAQGKGRTGSKTPNLA